MSIGQVLVASFPTGRKGIGFFLFYTEYSDILFVKDIWKMNGNNRLLASFDL